jgi:hypothetical protein
MPNPSSGWQIVEQPNKVPVPPAPPAPAVGVPVEQPIETQAAGDVRKPLLARRADRGWKGYVNDFLDGLSGEDSRRAAIYEMQGEGAARPGA